MIRLYCDKCGKELKRNEFGRLRRKLKCFSIEVIIAVDGVWDGGNLCHECIIDVINNGKIASKKE